MKKNLIIILLLIPFWGISQTTKPIEGFLGVKFGSSRQEVIAAIKAKGGILDADSPADKAYFTNVSLGPRAAETLFVFFTNDKLYKGVFYFKPDQEPQTIEYYNALVSDISEVYGKGKAVRTFKSPYQEGDGYEITALSSGHATFFTNFDRANGLIQIGIKTLKDESLYVLVYYEDKTLSAEVEKNEKQKAKSDY